MKNLKTCLDVQNKAFYFPGIQHGRRVTKVYGHWNWIELMNYLHLVFELQLQTARPKPAVLHAYSAWRTLYLLPPLLRIFLPSSAVNCLGDI